MSAPESLPTSFGRFHLLERLGRGGMAEVFLAEMQGPEGFTKRVALKRIHGHFSDSDSFHRAFIREARLGGLLSHPHIVQTLDFGEIDGSLYLAMELVDGCTLEALLQHLAAQGRRMPVTIAMQLAGTLARGLEHAHAATDRQGRRLALVHRDLKPSNILLSRHGEIKIADFGIARAARDLSQSTGEGLLKGTVLYMSPEQARGATQLDARSDVFALGLILYEMLAGQRFNDGTSQIDALQQAWSPPLERRLQALGSEVPRAQVAPVLERLLAAEPEGRYADAGEVATALRETAAALEGDAAWAAWLEREVSLIYRRDETAGTKAAPTGTGGMASGGQAAMRGDAASAGRSGQLGSLELSRTGTLPGPDEGGPPAGDLVHLENPGRPVGTSTPTPPSASSDPPPPVHRSEATPPTPAGGTSIRTARGRQRRGLQRALLWTVVSLVCIGLRWTGGLEPFDRWRHDLYARWLVPSPPIDAVKIVDLDDAVAPWPWPRDTLVRLLEHLLDEGRVASVTLDVILTDQAREPEAAFAAAQARLVALHRRNSGRLVVASSGTLLPPAPGTSRYRLAGDDVLAPALRGIPNGFATLLAPGRRGGPVRRAALVADTPAGQAPPVAFGLAVMAAAGGTPPQLELNTQRMRVGSRWIPLDPGGCVELPPVPAEGWTVIPASRLMGAGPLPEALALQLRDQRVMLGRYQDPLLDRVATPWGYRPGVAVQAALTAQLLDGRVRHRGGMGWDMSLQAAGLVSAGALWLRGERRRRPWRWPRMLAGVLFIFACLEVGMLFTAQLWVNVPWLEVGVLAVLTAFFERQSPPVRSGHTPSTKRPFTGDPLAPPRSHTGGPGGRSIAG